MLTRAPRYTRRTVFSRKSLLAVLAALAVLATACNRAGAEDTTTTTTTTTTSTTSTTTTTLPATSSTTTTTLPPVGNTINGLEADDELAERRAIAVKVDNHPKARPQSGIQEADAVFETIVEGGLTRFIAFFHQSDSDYLGPIRSGRPTDANVIAPTGAPFQFSGAQQWVKKYIRDRDVKIIPDSGATTFRNRSRPGPHNLYGDTPSMREYADEQEWPDDPPPPLFSYGYEPTEGAPGAEIIEFHWSDHPDVVWQWDGEQYLRFIEETPHEWVASDEVIAEAASTTTTTSATTTTAGEGPNLPEYDNVTSGQISADYLVVIKGSLYTAYDPAGRGSGVPSIETIGEAEALVFYDGQVVRATWSRGDYTEPFVLMDEAGNEIVVPPGRMWVNFFPRYREIEWAPHPDGPNAALPPDKG